MSLDQFVEFQIIVTNSGLTIDGFGLIGLVTHKNLFTNRTKLYSRTADMVTDGFASDSPEVNAAKRIFQQSPSPKKISLLRASGSAVIQKYEVGIASVKNSTVYTIDIEGEGFDAATVTITSGGSATNDAIATSLMNGINAIVDKTFTATLIGSSGTKTIQILGNAALAFFSVAIDSYTLLSIAQTHDDFDIAAELDEILKKDKTFYWVTTLYNSQDYVLAVADWVETNKKVYVVDVNESGSIEQLGGLGLGSDTPTDTLESLLLLSYTRTLYQWHQRPAAFMSAGLEGLLAPKNVGRWTAKGKTIIGVEPSTLDTDQTTNLLSRRANAYTSEGGKNVTWEGTVGNTTYAFLDVTVDLDWVAVNTVAACFGVSTSNDIVDYTDEDIAMYIGAIKGLVIQEALSTTHKIMAPGTPDDPNDPAPSITFPKVADIDPAVRALRELPDGLLSFRLAGAVHKVFVQATVSF